LRNLPIAVSGDGTVQKNNLFNIQIRRDFTVDRQPPQVEPNCELPHVPVMPETLLLLDLLVQETCVDLRQMSELVLADLGATLQILRLAGREYGMADDRPVRIADCISDLGLRPCLTTVSAQPIGRQEQMPEIAKLWAHSREIASCAKHVAQSTQGIDPDEAYLVGLLHAFGLLPRLLGWRESSVTDDTLMGLRLAKRWSLPRCVTEYFSEKQMPRYAMRWSAIMQKAHMQVGSVNSTMFA